MRKALAPLLVMLTLFAAVAPAEADARRPIDPFFLRTRPVPRQKMFLERLAHDLGAYGHSIGTPMHSRSYVGPELAPLPWISLGFGLEYGSGVFHRMAAARIDIDPFVSALYYSDTVYGLRYRAEFYAKPTRWLGLGTASDNSDAIGPHLTLQTPDKVVSLDSSFYYPLEKKDPHGDLTLRIRF